MTAHQPVVIQSVDELLSCVKSCKECCKGDYISFHCPLCPPSKFKPTRKKKVENHLRAVHWKARVEGRNGKSAVLCHLTEHSSSRHFHCTSCSRIIIRKENLKHHAQSCVNSLNKPVASNLISSTCAAKDSDSSRGKHRSENHQNNTEVAQESDTVTSDKDHCYATQSINPRTTCSTSLDSQISKKTSSLRATCTLCGKIIKVKWMKSHLKYHQSLQHDVNIYNHHHTVVIDPAKGMYCSSQSRSGPQIPIHLQKNTLTNAPISVCENNSCIELKSVAKRGGNCSFECDHVRFVPYAIPGRETILRQDTLECKRSENFITESRYNELKQCQELAESAGCPFVVLIPPHKSTYCPRQIHLSVFTGKKRFWCKLQRTIVTYDKQRNTSICRCTKSMRTCTHKLICKWYLKQELPEVMSSDDVQSFSDQEIDQQESDTEQVNGSQTSVPLKNRSQHFRSLTRSVPKDIPLEVRQSITNHKRDGILEITPRETSCVRCQGPLDVHLVSSRSKIIHLPLVVKDIAVYNKVCKRCQLLYQYREWNEGIHNFNYVLFLGLDVCHFIRAGLQNHVAIGRSVSMLQEMIGENVDTYSLHQAYLHFEACTDHEYSFHCVLCGYHPSILIFDTCRKVAFRHSVSALSIPPGAVSDTVDAKAFWSAVENSVRNHDTRQGKNTVTPSYEFWIPWIGENSRNGDLIYNTEIKKCSQSVNKDNEDPLTEPMPEETIINMLKDEKVSTIRRMCREVGVKPEGSSVDMIKRLRDMSISRGAFDKAYEKLFGCSGGWAVGCCHHGVVYAIKSLLRSESSRDYLDIERSLKHRPDVTICDIAYLLARQANKIIPHFYSPNEGRLAPDTDLNIARAEKGELDCEAEFLTNPILSPDCVESNKNPVTGSDVHYALIDWFHQENCKSKQEIFRRCSLLPELSGIIHTQAVEQLFSSLKRDIYYLSIYLSI